MTQEEMLELLENGPAPHSVINGKLQCMDLTQIPGSLAEHFDSAGFFVESETPEVIEGSSPASEEELAEVEAVEG